MHGHMNVKKADSVVRKVVAGRKFRQHDKSLPNDI